VTIAAIVPLAIAVLGLWRFFPTSEYVIGGKDPGVYINEGFAIARTGQLFRHDAVVANVPEASRDLFFRSHQSDQYYGVRFMGVYINDPSTGEVISGFPHLYPASAALGQALAGAAGATGMVGLWAVLGLLAVYFFGSRLVGRLPAAFAVGALALNVVEVWYGRYPNTEVAMQALLFAALLALARGHQDGHRFFGWVAGGLLVLLLFLRLDSMLALAVVGAALALRWIVQGEPPRWSTVLLLAIGSGLALAYYRGPLWWYSWQYRVNLPSMLVVALLGAAALAAVLVLGTQRARLAAWLTPALPLALGGALLALGLYALFLRQPGGRLTDRCLCLAHVPRCLRPLATLIAAMASLVMVTRRVLARSGLLPPVRRLLGVLLLQDPRRARTVLDGAALPAGHPARHAAAGLGRGIWTVHTGVPPHRATGHRGDCAHDLRRVALRGRGGAGGRACRIQGRDSANRPARTAIHAAGSHHRRKPECR
jgi:hypothetical protein